MKSTGAVVVDSRLMGINNANPTSKVVQKFNLSIFCAKIINYERQKQNISAAKYYENYKTEFIIKMRLGKTIVQSM